jgi:hypothetical protein
MTPLAPLLTGYLRDYMPQQRGYSPRGCETYAYGSQCRQAIANFSFLRTGLSHCRTGLLHAETEIGKTRVETGAAKPRFGTGNPENS